MGAHEVTAAATKLLQRTSDGALMTSLLMTDGTCVTLTHFPSHPVCGPSSSSPALTYPDSARQTPLV